MVGMYKKSKALSVWKAIKQSPLRTKQFKDKKNGGLMTIPSVYIHKFRYGFSKHIPFGGSGNPHDGLKEHPCGVKAL